MNIGAIGSNNRFQMGVISRDDPDLSYYDRQIERLQKKIEQVRNSDKLDQDGKQELIRDYQQQINDLRSQKQQRQMEKQTEALARQVEEKQAANEEEIEDGLSIDKETQKAFISIDSAKGVSSALSGAKAEQENDLRIASTTNYKRNLDPVGAKIAGTKLGKLNSREIEAWQGASKAITKSQETDNSKKTKPDAIQNRQDEEAAAEVSRFEVQEEGVEEEIHSTGSGTGRMEPGQFLDDEA